MVSEQNFDAVVEFAILLVFFRYEEQLKERESQLQKEDLSDMVAEHAAKQKVSVTIALMHDFVTTSPPSLVYENFFFEGIVVTFAAFVNLYTIKFAISILKARLGREMRQ